MLRTPVLPVANTGRCTVSPVTLGHVERDAPLPVYLGARWAHFAGNTKDHVGARFQFSLKACHIAPVTPYWCLILPVLPVDPDAPVFVEKPGIILRHLLRQ